MSSRLEITRRLAALQAAAAVPAPLPAAPAEMFMKTKPSGKNRSAIKAARKQSRKTRKK
jgi:hypothetical protein